VQSLEQILTIQIVPNLNREFGNPDFYKYGFRYADGVWFTILVNDHFINDRDLLFENYQYYIEIVGTYQGANETIVDQLAENLFSKLKAHGYGLMKTKGFQHKLAQYDPTGT
jgi:hypothetical protein